MYTSGNVCLVLYISCVHPIVMNVVLSKQTSNININVLLLIVVPFAPSLIPKEDVIVCVLLGIENLDKVCPHYCRIDCVLSVSL